MDRPASQVHDHHHIYDRVDCAQWSVEETRDFLMIRAELDPTFMETKRNKVLWEVISTKMKERGYNRSGEQCKCKWKNLVTRYKGFETILEEEEEEEGMMRQQFPLYKELQAIFTGRMQRMEASNSSKRSVQHLSSDEDEEIISDHNNKKKKKKNNMKDDDDDSRLLMMKEIVEELMKQQMQIETQWMKLYESKEEERRTREREWRQKMEALEKDKIMLDRRWREREEQTRIKEETRSEKTDALITLLLNRLTTPQHH